MRTLAIALLSAAALAVGTGAAHAQIRPGDCGISVSTKTGGSAGNLCRGFTCTPYPLAAGAQERVDIALRGPSNAAFWLFLSPVAPLCLKVPGFEHSLVIAPPLFFMGGGTLSIPDRILSCPDGLQNLNFTLPPGLPKGFKFSLQGVIMAQWIPGPAPTFTPAVTLTLQ